jgi:2-methylcitrate dehydratase PrpD
MSDPERAAAAFAATVTVDDLPAAVVEEASVLTADTMGAALAGATLPAVRTLAANAATDHGTVTMHGTGHTTTARQAAFVNGVGWSVMELNAGHKYAAGHPVVNYLPAVLAETEQREISGRTFLSALVAGYEVCVRTARASNPLADAYLPHGVWGAVGAAAGVMRCREGDVDTVRTAMRIAASFAQHTRFEATNEGATGVRNGSVGMANVGGILAADLAVAGFTGLEAGVQRHLQATAKGTFDAAVLGDRLGDHWEILRGYYKRHAAGRLVHPAIDAVADLQHDHGFTAADVASVEVATYEQAARWLGDDRPKGRLQAKSSIPFAVATRLVNGVSGVDAFEPETFTDEVYEVLERVSVTVDPAIDERVPDARGARVRVELTDGTVHTGEVDHARGGPERPYSREELRAKFDSIVVPELGSTAAADLWTAATGLPDTDPTRMSRLAGGAR